MRRLVMTVLASACLQALAQTAPMTPDIPAKFEVLNPDADYIKKDVMIPMRDGVRLHTVIVIPKGAQNAPIMFTRTPYNASGRTGRSTSPHMNAILGDGDDMYVANGYIRVIQDVRGKYGSEGDYVMTRPPIGPLNATKVDHVTDAWDSIDWLVKNVKESNGRVGMVGSSYEGFTVMMALLDPHPALLAAAPMSPMVDGWMGDDWFHYGAFREVNLAYMSHQTAARGSGQEVPTGVFDEYETFLRAGSAGAYSHKYGLDVLPFVKKLSEHQSYDSYWQYQALDKLVGQRGLKIPTMTIVGRWDQEDIYGAYAVYQALEKQDKNNDRNFLVVGPWRHSGVNYEGSSLGPIRFTGDTAKEFRRDYLLPFFNQYLKDGAPKANTPPVLSYETGVNAWRHLPRWPLADAKTALYLKPGGAAGFDKGGEGFDEYVSDPAKPIPFVQRPVHMNDSRQWGPWLVSDQRPYSDRTDVLTYVTPVLTTPLHIAGQTMVNLFASTSGSDSDWVVKLIDVYPDEVPGQPELGGYQLGIAMDIFRGRYRDSFEKPSAIPSNTVQRYRFALPNADHIFLPGHKVMVQVQSSWFPLYDRNPQTFVPNIFNARPEDYRKATQRVYHAPGMESALELPVAQ